MHQFILYNTYFVKLFFCIFSLYIVCDDMKINNPVSIAFFHSELCCRFSHFLRAQQSIQNIMNNISLILLFQFVLCKFTQEFILQVNNPIFNCHIIKFCQFSIFFCYGYVAFHLVQYTDFHYILNAVSLHLLHILKFCNNVRFIRLNFV